MREYILLMHDDSREASRGEGDGDWGRYLEGLSKSGRFLGGSAIGGGECFALSGVSKAVTSHISGYLVVQAESIEEARCLLAGNPVYEAGGTVEIRELLRS